MAIKINSLELENVKRIKAVKIEPSENGLTVIGGRNNQGKTSVLDSIAWALGGNRKKPSNPQREGSMSDPYLKVVLSNGLIVERKGKNSDLTVTDPEGKRHGQTLLDSFIGELALDLPKFIEASNKEKADILLQIIGLKDELYELEEEERQLEQERLLKGREARSRESHANELPEFEDAPKEHISATELIQQQQEILAKNGENQRKRQQYSQLQHQAKIQSEEIEKLELQLANLKTAYAETLNDLTIAEKTVEQLQDESTAEIENSIANIETINEKVTANKRKNLALKEAGQLREEYNLLNDKVKDKREEKYSLLEKADLPLPELSIEDGELTYKGQKWDGMSGSQQLVVATAIVRKLQPECGFVLMDKLEQMDSITMQEFGAWLEKEGLQVIATRVTNNSGEATLIIEDGYVEGVEGEEKVIESATDTFTFDFDFN